MCVVCVWGGGSSARQLRQRSPGNAHPAMHAYARTPRHPLARGTPRLASVRACAPRPSLPTHPPTLTHSPTHLMRTGSVSSEGQLSPGERALRDGAVAAAGEGLGGLRLARGGGAPQQLQQQQAKQQQQQAQGGAAEGKQEEREEEELESMLDFVISAAPALTPPAAAPPPVRATTALPPGSPLLAGCWYAGEGGAEGAIRRVADVLAAKQARGWEGGRGGGLVCV